MSTDEPSAIMQQKARVAGVFDRAAATYDQIGPEIFAHFGRRLVELTQISPGATVLDVATGRGAALFPAAAAAGAQGHVTGIDISAAMVRATASEIDRRGLAANATVAQMDGEHLDFSDASFDYTLCGLSLMFFPQVESAMGEVRRVLKPGGKIGVTTWDQSFSAHTRWLDEIVASYLPSNPVSSPPVTRLEHVRRAGCTPGDDRLHQHSGPPGNARDRPCHGRRALVLTLVARHARRAGAGRSGVRSRWFAAPQARRPCAGCCHPATRRHTSIAAGAPRHRNQAGKRASPDVRLNGILIGAKPPAELGLGDPR